jgi:ribosomal protein L37AE/L43A
MSAAANCPSCAAPIAFRAATTLLAVCGACRCIVVRGGATLEAVGRSNEVLVTGSALRLGLSARYRGKAFTVIGRTQLKHDTGGIWDEWLIRFADDKLAWVSESQGRLALYTEETLHSAPALLRPSDAVPGSQHLTPVGTLVVLERGEASVVAEEGELVTRTLPGARRPFVDFSSRGGRCATLDFGSVGDDGSPARMRFFVGRNLRYAELGLDGAPVLAPKLPSVPGATAIHCPHCAAPLEKPRTDSLSVSCAHCGSLLAVTDGAVAFLSVQESLKYRPLLALGKRATLDAEFFCNDRKLRTTDKAWVHDLEVEVVAHVVRSVMIDGAFYTFEEYLLATERDGFFWLVQSDGNWLFVRDLDAGEVKRESRHARIGTDVFQFEQSVEARVEQVLGELPFRVSQGETAKLIDFRRAPRTISREQTGSEVLWTECLDIPRAQLQRVFGVSVPAPSETSDSESSPAMAFIASMAILVFIAIFIFVVEKCDDDEQDGNYGGHVGSSHSGGFSFGK